MTDDIEQLARLLGQKLLAKNWTVTCAESCTGGGIGYAITDISGSSTWFKQGLITYSNKAKQQLLGVSAQTLISFGAVSQQTVEEMAKGAAHSAQSSVAISVSGIAGPEGGSIEKPVGTVWFGFYVDGLISSEHQIFSGNRKEVRLKAIAFAMAKMTELI